MTYKGYNLLPPPLQQRQQHYQLHDAAAVVAVAPVNHHRSDISPSPIASATSLTGSGEERIFSNIIDCKTQPWQHSITLADIHPLLREPYCALTRTPAQPAGPAQPATPLLPLTPASTVLAVQRPVPLTSTPLATSTATSTATARPASLFAPRSQNIQLQSSSLNRSSSYHTPRDPPLKTRDPNTSAPVNAALRLLRKPAPGLIARLKQLDTRSKRRSTNPEPASAQNHEAVIERRGRPWTDNSPPRVHLSLPGSAVPQPAMPDPRPLDVGDSFQSTVMAALGKHEESDISSIISSDHHVMSESDGSEEILDTHKYRLPDVGKSRGSSRNGFILEDGRAVERERPPSPPPKDDQYIPSRQSTFAPADLLPGTSADGPYFNPYALHKAASVYTLSRASLSNQLAQLTSIKLPDASSLESSIASIPTSNAAARVLNEAAGQIKIWISKANEVLNGLDAEDDVEWAAAAGLDGLAEVDNAIKVFETLIIVFVNAIENLESRPDISNLPTPDQTAIVDRMEKILEDWEQIKHTLKQVKKQVELAMEWEELWNTVLGEIGMEQENLSRLIFEMEERRHKNSLLDSLAEPGQSLDIKELETIVEEVPIRDIDVRAAASRIDFRDIEEPTAVQPPPTHDDSNILALTARMQPLRASLDFLPMRLASFLIKSGNIFPTACEELESRMQVLEAKFNKLEGDAEALRKELGEDRWVLIFRKAGRQAMKMCESVERSVAKLRDGLDEGTHHTNPAGITKKIENYEAKKEHYGPAIQQVLAIIDRGVATRLTVNGEILRLQTDMQRRWADLEGLMKSMDFALDQLNIQKTRQLRDSVSTVLSEQRSVSSSTGTLVDTPGSSPASSVVLLNRRGSEHGTSTPFSSKSRQSSFTSNTTARGGKRLSSLPTPGHTGNLQKTPVTKSSASNLRAGVTGASSRLYPPPPPRSVSRQEEHADNSNRPKWNASTNMSHTTVGHNFKPLSATTPSPYRKENLLLRSPRSFSHSLMSSGLPSPLSRTPSRPASTVPPSTPLALNKSTSTAALRPKMTAPSTTSSIPQSSLQKPKLSSSHIPTTPALDAKRSGLPRAFSHMTPAATPTTPSASTRISRHVSHSSVASSSSTLTDRTIQPKSGMPTPRDTPTSSTTDVSVDDSPSSRGTARPSRPGTAMAIGGNRRTSLLPQPKRAVSSNVTATAAATAAMNGVSAPSGRNSRLGRGSSMCLRASERAAEEQRPRWKG